jgi:hypothetical protein
MELRLEGFILERTVEILDTVSPFFPLSVIPPLITLFWPSRLCRVTIRSFLLSFFTRIDIWPIDLRICLLLKSSLIPTWRL